MAFQNINRNSGLFSPEASDQLNKMIEGVDSLISGYKTVEKKYRFSQTSVEKITGAKKDWSFHINKIHVVNCTFDISSGISPGSKIGTVESSPLDDVLATAYGKDNSYIYPVIIKKNGEIRFLSSTNSDIEIMIYTQYIV